jgi:protein-tyrosine kinase
VTKAGQDMQSGVDLGVGTKITGDLTAEALQNRFAIATKINIPTNNERLLRFRGHSRSHPNIEAHKRLRARVLTLSGSRSLSSIGISSAVAGEGKTLTAANLGICLAELGVPVLLVDADLRTRGLSKLLGASKNGGLFEVLDKTANREESVAQTSVPHLFVLPAGNVTCSPSELFAGPEWGQFLEWTRQHFMMTIVDCPPVLPVADTELLLPRCDGVIMVAREGVTDPELMVKANNQFEKKLVGVVLNGAELDSHPYHGYGS